MLVGGGETNIVLADHYGTDSDAVYKALLNNINYLDKYEIRLVQVESKNNIVLPNDFHYVITRSSGLFIFKIEKSLLSSEKLIPICKITHSLNEYKFTPLDIVPLVYTKGYPEGKDVDNYILKSTDNKYDTYNEEVVESEFTNSQEPNFVKNGVLKSRTKTSYDRITRDKIKGYYDIHDLLINKS